jgi:FkbM family methyltransferase
MTREYTLNTVDGGTRELVLNDELVEHFGNNDQNHALTIIRQINDEHFYDHYFKDKKDLVVVDIGANLGLFSLHVESACKKLLAIEPTPSHYRKLEYLTEGTIIEGRNIALSNEDGFANFNLDASNTTMNGLVRHNTQSTISVPCMKLKTLFESNGLDHVDLVKLDIEGSEMLAITKETLSEVSNMVDSWFCEVHPTYSLDGMNQEQNMVKLMGIFEECGYKVNRTNFETFFASK